MIILGLLLLAAAIVAAVELIVANDGAPITVHMWRWSWTVDAFWLAVTGAAILAAALLGLLMLRAGSKRQRRLRRERRQLANENRQLAKRAEVAEATDEQPVHEGAPRDHDIAPQAYPPPAETTDQPRPYAPAADTTAQPRAYSPSAETTAQPPTYQPSAEATGQQPRREYPASGEQTYAGDSNDGRHER
ncbi:MAG: hypothetical protein M3Y44_05290 [Actinomycetota bacterium]|nr:hypothetical protein [Actinomycetota bacterium]